MLTKLSIEKLREGILKKEFSFYELISEYKKNFQRFKKINAHTNEYWQEAKEQAKKLDNQNADFEKHPLLGMPISVKDMFLTKGHKTTAASKILKTFVAPYESFTTQKLKNSGYLMPFKTNLDEFAMGSSNETSAFGPVINPWMLEDKIPRIPGGSSGGSAAAVAAHMCIGATGTDTGGSIRQPASLSGIVGFKPTYGRCSRQGVIAFASSLDCPGAFARTVQDTAIILENMAGYDKHDCRSIKNKMPKLSNIKGDVKGKTIGIATAEFEKMTPEYQQKVSKLIEYLKQEGAIVKEIHIPSLEMALHLYYIINPAESASNLARYDGIRYGVQKAGKSFEEIITNTRNLFGSEVKRRILIGNFVLFAKEYDAFFGKAQKIRQDLTQEMNELFSDVDTILLPSTPNSAFALGENRDIIQMYHQDLYTTLANIYGAPAMSLPFFETKLKTVKNQNDEWNFLPTQKFLPMGIQIMAGKEKEDNIVAVAKKIEEMINWKGLENV